MCPGFEKDKKDKTITFSIKGEDRDRERHKLLRSVYDALWCNGGCIAQCEFGPGANPENVDEVFAAWNDLTE